MNNVQDKLPLALMGNYGGPTETMPPLPGSPAIGNGAIFPGPTGFDLTTDQRGLPLPTTSAPDIGAVQTPPPPGGVSIGTFSSSQIDLSWTNSASYPTDGVDVLISTDGTNFSAFDSVGPGVATYDAMGLNGGTTYYFELQSDEDGLQSNPTAPMSATTTFASLPLTPFSATPVGPNEIDLAWTPPASPAIQSTDILTSTDGTNYTQIDSVPAGQATYQDIGLTPGQHYWFELIADIDGTQQSAPATADAITPIDPWNLQASGASTVNEGGTYSLSILTNPLVSAPTVGQFTVDWGDGTVSSYSPQEVAEGPLTHVFAAGVDESLIGVTASTAAAVADPFSVMVPAVTVYVIPTAPYITSVQIESSTEAMVYWSAPSQSADDYAVLRSDNGGPLTTIGEVDPGTTTFDDITLMPSDNVEYAVQAIGAISTLVSTSTTSSQQTTPSGLPTFSVSLGAQGSNSVDASWSYAGNDDAGFEIEEEDETAGTNFQTIDTPGPVYRNITSSQTYGGLSGGDTYLFRIRADHKDGSVSQYVQSDPITIPIANAPALDVTTIDTFGIPGVRVGWSGVLSWAGVSIQEKTTALPGNAWSTVWYGDQRSGAWPANNDDDSTDTEDQGNAIDPGYYGPGTYTYRISSVDDYNNPTKWSAPQSVTIEGPTGAAVSLSVSGTTITANWPATAGSSLLMEPDGSAPLIGNGAVLPVVGGQLNSAGNEYTATLSGLIPGTQYDFTLWTPITSGSFAGEHSFYNASSTTDGTAPGPVPNSPARIMEQVVTGTTVAGNVVHLAWTNSSNNETGFKVERACLTGEIADLTYKVIATLSADVTTFDDHGMQPGNYDYEIVAFNPGGSATAQVNVSVWPAGFVEALDGTTNTPTDNTLINRFRNDYKGSAQYQPGVPYIPLFTGSELATQIDNAYTDVENFYQPESRRPLLRSEAVPLDIVGYSRGGFAAMVLMYMLDNIGIPILSTKKTVSVPIYAPFGLFVIGHKNEDVYQYYKPHIRFVGLISPVGQSSLIAELAAAATLGAVQLNPGFNTAIPSGSDVFAAYYPDAGIAGLLSILQNPGLLPQAPAGGAAFIPPADDHASISRDQLVEVAMWKKANGDNVPIPERPSDIDIGYVG